MERRPTMLFLMTEGGECRDRDITLWLPPYGTVQIQETCASLCKLF
jgi:hypothetical protein